ncbi:unnamed protein product [Durusdinium trenchii]|uniref:Uncharacterized protein n=2 Tax=Durusdinium trenchii TaxID=1381693 RepID=A0ABP0MJ23_9DINO
MSQDLIAQLTAVAVKLEGCANRLQESIKKKKSKNKHYREVIEEVNRLTALARDRLELGRALVKASEKAGKAKPKAKASPASSANSAKA